MSNTFFRFKQFTVYHDLCAMKVGTDGVLIGSWVNCGEAKSILDVGTGTGLIALMLAQRSDAEIQALDIDEAACTQARINVKNSPFRNRISIIKSAYQTFIPQKKYDLIVSNPPYFSSSLKSPDLQRSTARHNDDLPFDCFVQKSKSLLSSKGKLSVILPFETYDVINRIAVENNLNLCRKTQVKPTPASVPKRILLEYSLHEDLLVESELVIEISRHNYSEEYIALTRDFYLKL